MLIKIKYEYKICTINFLDSTKFILIGTTDITVHITANLYKNCDKIKTKQRQSCEKKQQNTTKNRQKQNKAIMYKQNKT